VDGAPIQPLPAAPASDDAFAAESSTVDGAPIQPLPADPVPDDAFATESSAVDDTLAQPAMASPAAPAPDASVDELFEEAPLLEEGEVTR
jgi:hypothetical protein